MGNANTTATEKKLYANLKLQQSNLFLIKAPYKFARKKFGELFEYLLMDHKMIAIGLYRAKIYAKGNYRPYVFIDPQADVQLNEQDKVYVFSSREPKEFESNDFEQEKRMMSENLAFNIKSKLQGEEGRIDMEHAREISKINQEMFHISKNFENLNKTHFSQGINQKGQRIILFKASFFR